MLRLYCTTKKLLVCTTFVRLIVKEQNVVYSSFATILISGNRTSSYLVDYS